MPSSGADRDLSGQVAAVVQAAGSVALFLLFLGMFFFSGASALVYEVVWTRLLALIFGITLHAISAVLASFMAGLALGSYLAGRVADRVRWPLLYYASLEIAIGLLGLMSLAAIKQLTPLYLSFYQATDGSLALVSALRFLGACGVMLLPTALMGATLPFMVRASLQHLNKVGENFSLLYGMNTAGAALGTLAAGFVLIGNYGLQASVYVAAALNLSVGLAALLIALLVRPRHGRQGTLAPDAPLEAAARPLPRPIVVPSGMRWGVLIGLGISGFCALAYEVIWFRILDLFLSGTTYAFTTMLVVFLLGLSIGSIAMRPTIGWRLNWPFTLGLLEFGIGLEALLSIELVARVPLLRDVLLQQPELAPLAEQPVLTMGLVAALILLPLAVLLGMTFPVAAQAIAGDGHDSARRIGALNASNTLGAIAGSLAGGLWLVPVLGSQQSLTLLAFVNIGAALLLWWLALEFHPRLRFGLPLAAVVFLYVGNAPDLYQELYPRLFKDNELLWYEEGLESTVSVQRRPDGVQMLYLNSREQAFDLPLMARYHQTMGQLPMLLHPDPREVLVIGLGGGATPGAVSLHRDASIDVIELSPSVVTAARFFEHINHRVLQQAHVNMVVDDGRNHLLLTDKNYDVITADVIQAQHAGSGNLYSTEYYALAKEALEDDGLMVQWANPAQPGIYPLVVRTFSNAFPYVTVWYQGSMLVGSKSPQRVDKAQLEANFARPHVREAAASIGLGSADELLAYYGGDVGPLLAQIGPGPLLTDDRPLAEYFRSIPDSGQGLLDFDQRER